MIKGNPQKVALVLTLFMFLTGCESAPVPLPGMAAVRIRVIAEPKTGAPSGSIGDYDTSTPRSEAFELVNYDELDEIVVWLEPVSNATATAPPKSVVIDLSAKNPARALNTAISIGQKLILHNTGPQPAVFYSVSDGNDFDTGTLRPGNQSTYIVRSAGLIEILTDTARDPVAKVFAAPSRWVSIAHSGGTVDFTDIKPGSYKLHSWHPRLPGHETPLTLTINQSSTATIKVGVNALPKAGRK